MRYALVADLHGRPKALRRVLADVALVGVDEIVCLGDYLEAKVPRRRHDPSRHWPLESVVDVDPVLWSRLAALRRIVGNQEIRIRELLRPEQTPPGLAALLAGPESARLDGILGLHGHQIRWSPGSGGGPGQPRDLLLPAPADIPREPVVVVGHTHQVSMFDVVWEPDSSGGGPGRGPVVRPRPVPVRPDHPVPVPLPLPVLLPVPPAETLVINVGPARGRPSNWLLYDTARCEIVFRQTPS